MQTQWPHNFIFCISSSLLIWGCESEPNINAATTGSCSPADLLGATVIVEEEFIREKGKPSTEHLDFHVNANSDICILIVSGGVDSFGSTVSSPASMTVSLDETSEIARPSDFNSKPSTLLRAVSDVSPGQHSLSITLRGKPSSRSHISVLSKSTGEELPEIPPVLASRIHNPKFDQSFLVDESIVVFDEAPEDPSLTFSQLPFPAVVISSLKDVPIYRIFMPGVADENTLYSYIDQIKQLPGVKSASPHRVGVAKQSALPSTGDSSYISGTAPNRYLNDNAWHLEQVNAEPAWDYETHGAPVAVIDNGFNVNHPGWGSGTDSNLKGCWGSNGQKLFNVDCSLAAGEMAPEPDTCLETILGTGEEFHGTAVAGLIGAKQNNIEGESIADTLGVAWDIDLHLVRSALLGVVVDDDSIFQDFDDECKDDALVSSNYAMLLMAEELIQNEIKTINISLANPLFKPGTKKLTDFYSSQDDPKDYLEGMIEEYDNQWGRLLERYKEAMIVQAAGNYGSNCTLLNGIDDLFCTSRAVGFACAVDDPKLEKQVLCVGRSEEGATMDNRTSKLGDRIAAPGVEVPVMSFDGPLTWKTGTSFSSPITAGTVAILRTINDQMNPRIIHDIIITGGHKFATYNDEDYRIVDFLASAQQTLRCRNEYADFEAGANGCPSFSDVPFFEWYYEPIQRLSCNCVISGYPDQTFNPGGELNRAEAIKIIFELAFPGELFPAPSEKPFNDVEVSEWYAGYAHFGLENGLLTANEKFFPGSSIKRKDFAVILRKSAGKSEVAELGHLSQNYSDIVSGDLEPMFDFSDATTEDNPSVYAAASRCIMTGQSPGFFGSENSINRAEASKAGCLAIYGFGSEQCGESLSDCEKQGP